MANGNETSFTGHRSYVSRDELIKSFILGKWFSFEDVELNMNRASFNRKLKAMSEGKDAVKGIVKRRVNKYGTPQFKVNKKDLPALLIKPKACKPKKKKVEAKDLKAIYEAELYDLAVNA